MKSEVLPNSGSGVIGVAILASVQAAIVHADIDACHAAALFTLILILGQRQGLTDDSLQQFTVDALPVANAKPGQVYCLRTGFQFQIVPAGNIRKPPRQFINLAFSKGSKLLTQMPVQIHKADDALMSVAGNPLRQFLEVVDMILCGVLGSQNNGIIPPDNPFRANLLGKLLKSRDDHIIFAGNARFQVLAVGIQGELKVKWVVVQQVKLVQHLCGILRPEHDAVHQIRGKGYAADLFGIHRIAGADKPGFQAAEEPVRIVGWNISSSAGADDHGITSMR